MALYRARADVNLARQELTAAERAQALGDLDHAIRLEKPDNPLLARDHTNQGRLLALEHRNAEALAAWDAARSRSSLTTTTPTTDGSICCSS